MYNQAIELRDTIVHALKKDERIGNITAVTNDGFLIATIDVAMPSVNGNCQSFRVVVIPHKLDYSVFT